MFKKTTSFLFSVLLLLSLAFIQIEKTTPVHPLVYKALIAQVGTGAPYELEVYENTIGPVSFVREQAGVFALVTDHPVFTLDPIPFVQATIYEDGAGTPEMVEASPEDETTVRFIHYQQVLGNMVLLDGTNGSFAIYIEIEVYP